MITISREKENPSLDRLIELATQGAVIVTQNDKPVLAFISVSEDDIQTWQLGENAEFLELMRRSWARLQVEGGISLAEARKRLLQDQS
jgi:hypothetical protein